MKVIQSNFNGGRVARRSVVHLLDSTPNYQHRNPLTFLLDTLSLLCSFVSWFSCFEPRWCKGQAGQSHATFFGRKQTMKSCAAILALACAFGATANAAELEVNQYEGPT